MDVAQTQHRVRLEWGSIGGAAIARGADVAVVVDVLTFGTVVGLATDRGSTVVAVDDDDDASGLGATELPSGRSLTDLADATTTPARLAVPAGDGGRVCRAVGGVATTVAVAGLRNAEAVAAWLAREHDAEESVVAVVPAGTTWSDGTLRPAVEDLWAAGAVLAALEDFDWPGLSPEAALAADAYRLIVGREESHLAALDAGRDLSTDELSLLTRPDPRATVPLLSDRGFVAAP